MHASRPHTVHQDLIKNQVNAFAFVEIGRARSRHFPDFAGRQHVARFPPTLALKILVHSFGVRAACAGRSNRRPA